MGSCVDDGLGAFNNRCYLRMIECLLDAWVDMGVENVVVHRRVCMVKTAANWVLEVRVVGTDDDNGTE